MNGAAPPRRRRRSRRGCLGCLGCLAPFLLLGVGATLALSFAPRPGGDDELDLSGLTRLLGEGMIDDDGEVRDTLVPGEGTKKVGALLEQLGGGATQGSLPTEEFLGRLQDGVGMLTPRPSLPAADPPGERVFAPRDLPHGDQPGEASADPTGPAPKGRVWMWEDKAGATHITKERPPPDAKVLSVSDPGEGHIKIDVHDDGRRLQAPATRSPPSTAPPAPPSLRALGPALLEEVNRLRADPAAWAARLAAVRDTFQGNVYRGVSQRLIQSREGPSAFEEAIAALRATGPLPALVEMKACLHSSRDHAAWLGRTGRRGHLGADDSRPIDRVKALAPAGSFQAVGEVISYGAVLPEEVVMSWIVDDGVSDRGHREALLDPRYTLAGASCHAHLLHPVCVLDLVEPPAP